MIGQSMINVNSGGRQRLSGIVAALSLLGFILFASGLIETIPMAASARSAIIQRTTIRIDPFREIPRYIILPLPISQRVT